MIRSIFILITALAAFAQDRSPDDVLKTWFPDGTGLEIHTESSGPKTPLSTSGAVVVKSGNEVHRVVVGKDGVMLFAYDIEAKKSAQGTVTMRIKPVDQQKIRREGWFPKDKVAPGAVPTFTAARDFPPLRAGDQVQVDILFHPETGEKIFDVLRISSEPQPVPKPRKPSANQFSFQEVRVAVNGKTIHEPRNNWIIGPAAMIFLPGYGRFYLSLTPSPDYPFKASGWVDHSTLRFHAGSDLVEVFGKSNVLQKSEYGTVWVYSEPDPVVEALEQKRRRYTPQHPDRIAAEAAFAAKRGIEIMTDDDVESLIPKKKQQED